MLFNNIHQKLQEQQMLYAEQTREFQRIVQVQKMMTAIDPLTGQVCGYVCSPIHVFVVGDLSDDYFFHILFCWSHLFQMLLPSDPLMQQRSLFPSQTTNTSPLNNSNTSTNESTAPSRKQPAPTTTNNNTRTSKTENTTLNKKQKSELTVDEKLGRLVVTSGGKSMLF